MINLLIVAITCAANLLLGAIVLVRNPRANSSRAFFSMSLFVSLWALTNYITGLDSVGLTWNGIANGLAFTTSFLAIASVAWFSYYFPVKAKSRATTKAILLTITTAIAIICATPLIAGNVTKAGGELQFSIGPLLPFYVLASLALLWIALRNFLRVYNHNSVRERQQVLYVLTGIGVPALLGLFTNAIIPSFTSSWQTAQLGPALTIFLVAMTATSIVKHRLFDLRLAVARSMAYGFSIIAVVVMFMLIAFGLSRVVFGFSLDFGEELLLAAFSAMAALLFQPVKRFFDRFTNRVFYRDAYDSQQLFNSFNEALVTNAELEQLLTAATDIVSKALKIEFCVAALNGRDLYHPRVIGTVAVAYEPDDIKKGQRLLSGVHTKIIVADYLDNGDPIKQLFAKNGTAVMIRLTDGQDLGYLILGNKRSGNPYTLQDIRVLDALTDELVIAIQNALRFEEIEKFNETLQQKIEAATRKLRNTNNKLRRLDETKDDFISMASHQLRTPLTSVKGYVSMVLDGDAGKINALQRKLLNQSFISSQRMVYLISDLLNVSRLRTGKFVIEPVTCNLGKVIRDEIEQLQETAKGRNLDLTYEKPEHFPNLMLDETKMRQVIMNFIDNAIYYTPSGGRITVRLEDHPHSVEFTVTDNGIGVPKHEQHHLFSKFFRANNAKRARPDGTGLGLFMAKKVVVAQGGAIIFRSQEGKGSTFGFTFSKEKLDAAISAIQAEAAKTNIPGKNI